MPAAHADPQRALEANWEGLGLLLTPDDAEPLAGKHGWDGGKCWDVERGCGEVQTVER